MKNSLEVLRKHLEDRHFANIVWSLGLTLSLGAWITLAWESVPNFVFVVLSYAVAALFQIQVFGTKHFDKVEFGDANLGVEFQKGVFSFGKWVDVDQEFLEENRRFLQLSKVGYRKVLLLSQLSLFGTYFYLTLYTRRLEFHFMDLLHLAAAAWLMLSTHKGLLLRVLIPNLLSVLFTFRNADPPRWAFWGLIPYAALLIYTLVELQDFDLRKFFWSKRTSLDEDSGRVFRKTTSLLFTFFVLCCVSTAAWKIFKNLEKHRGPPSSDTSWTVNKNPVTQRIRQRASDYTSDDDSFDFSQPSQPGPRNAGAENSQQPIENQVSPGVGQLTNQPEHAAVPDRGAPPVSTEDIKKLQDQLKGFDLNNISGSLSEQDKKNVDELKQNFSGFVGDSDLKQALGNASHFNGNQETIAQDIQNLASKIVSNSGKAAAGKVPTPLNTAGGEKPKIEPEAKNKAPSNPAPAANSASAAPSISDTEDSEMLQNAQKLRDLAANLDKKSPSETLKELQKLKDPSHATTGMAEYAEQIDKIAKEVDTEAGVAPSKGKIQGSDGNPFGPEDKELNQLAKDYQAQAPKLAEALGKMKDGTQNPDLAKKLEGMQKTVSSDLAKHQTQLQKGDVQTYTSNLQSQTLDHPSKPVTPPKLPKFDALFKNLERLLPIILFFVGVGLVMMLLKKFQKPPQASEEASEISIEIEEGVLGHLKAKMASLDRTELSLNDRVIQRFQLALELMQELNFPKPQGLPVEFFPRTFPQALQKPMSAPFSGVTEVFTDVYYGKFIVSKANYDFFSKNMTKIFKEAERFQVKTVSQRAA